jgi:hypothetical protein
MDVSVTQRAHVDAAVRRSSASILASMSEPTIHRTGKIRVGLVSGPGSRSGSDGRTQCESPGGNEAPAFARWRRPGLSSYTSSMPRGCLTRSVDRALSRTPGPRRVAVLKLFVAAELAVLARDHVMRLDRHERQRLVELVRIGRGRRRNLSGAEREELAGLMARVEPRLLAGHAVEKLSSSPPSSTTPGLRPSQTALAGCRRVVGSVPRDRG